MLGGITSIPVTRLWAREEQAARQVKLRLWLSGLRGPAKTKYRGLDDPAYFAALSKALKDAQYVTNMQNAVHAHCNIIPLFGWPFR